MNVCDAGRQDAETRKRVDIYKSASVTCARATGAGQTVCDAERRTQNAETHEKGVKYKSVRSRSFMSKKCSIMVFVRLKYTPPI